MLVSKVEHRNFNHTQCFIQVFSSGKLWESDADLQRGTALPVPILITRLVPIDIETKFYFFF